MMARTPHREWARLVRLVARGFAPLLRAQQRAYEWLAYRVGARRVWIGVAALALGVLIAGSVPG